MHEGVNTARDAAPESKRERERERNEGRTKRALQAKKRASQVLVTRNEQKEKQRNAFPSSSLSHEKQQQSRLVKEAST